MRIQQINSFSYSSNTKNNTINKAFFTSKNNNNVSFRSLETWILALAAREGYTVFSKSKQQQRKFLKTLNRAISYGEKEDFVLGIQTISKTPNSFYDSKWSKLGILTSFYGDNVDLIQDSRWRGLQRIHEINKDNYINVQIKKDFITSLFENGHPISPTFVKQFKNLDDRIYYPFKREIVDIALYSKKYNEKRCDDKAWFNQCSYVDKDSSIYKEEYAWAEPGLYDYTTEGFVNIPVTWGTIGAAFQNLQLISSLDKNVYGAFIEQRRFSVEEMKKIAEQALKFKNSYHGNWNDSEAKPFHDEYWQKLKNI